MNQTEILQIVTTIIQETMGLHELVVTHETSATEIEEWDSMTHIQLIVAIESKFKVRFALGELNGLKNVGDMIALITKKLN
jgi:acyl carrier protein